MFNMFFMSPSTGKIVTEIALNLHTPPLWEWSNQGFTFSSGGLTAARVATIPNNLAYYQPPDGWLLVIIQNSIDKMFGTLDLLAIINDVKSRGWLAGNELLSSVKMGCETSGGVGELRINNFSVSKT